VAGLPRLTEGEDVYDKPEYLTTNLILVDLFLTKYPK
jgi:hypothetical protein